MWIQTWHPAHPLFEALRSTTTRRLPRQQLQEREAGGHAALQLPGAGAGRGAHAGGGAGFLNAASTGAQDTLAAREGFEEVMARITLYGAVPMTVQRVANVERAQMLVESGSRAALQRFLAAWQEILRQTRTEPAHKGLIRWAIDVDPLTI
jgi:primosomal protein N' (replication factor Y)